jgi:hypothetical protein
VDGVLIAMGTKLFQFHTARRVTTVLLSGVSRNTSRTLVRIGPALCAFKGNDEADAFSHNRSPRIASLTQTAYYYYMRNPQKAIFLDFGVFLRIREFNWQCRLP